MALVHSETQDRWYFSKEELQKTPSVLSGMDVAKELSYRQQSASLIQDMGQRLTVTQLTINTAIVYMHRFYMFHSFSTMNRNVIAPCCLFLSAKLEEQPRKLEHVLKVAHACLHREKDEGPLDTKSEKYLEQAQELVINESVLLQTLGFELTVDHPHTHVVRITQLVRASKDLAQTSYFMATNSLHLTPFCIEHKPSVVACVCIHLACKWSNWEFPRSSDNKDWWEYADSTLTKQSLDSICQEFLNIIESCPSRLKRRINTVTIYKGGHKPKPLPDAKSATVSKNGTSSSKGESSSSRPVENNAKTSESTEVKSDTTLTITSSAAVVETATSKITLPTLPPLTTKYATQTTTTANISKDLHGNSVGGSGSKSLSASMKHKHREHDDNNSPAKKMKTMHASSSSLHSSHMKHGTPGSSKHGSSSSHHHHRQQLHSSMKPSSKSSSSQNNHGQTHHKHRSHTSHSAHKLPHKHHSPLEGKKSSGDRHRRSSSSSKTKPDAATLSTPQSRVNETENGKKDPIMISGTTKESFTSPPGPQRLPVVSKLPPLPSTNKKLPPLPTPNQAAPPPPPPQNLPPPPPPPPT